MAKASTPTPVVLLSDSEGESNNSLTVLKVKPKRKSITKRPTVKRLASNRPKNQTRIDSFFHTLTIKSDKPKLLKSNSFGGSLSKGSFQDGEQSSLSQSNTTSDSCKLFSGIKRTATSGSSPSTKLHKVVEPKLTELKGKK